MKRRKQRLLPAPIPSTHAQALTASQPRAHFFAQGPMLFFRRPPLFMHFETQF
jgi:hypothetical protein